MDNFAQKTVEIVRSTDWTAKIDDEINRLLKSGLVNQSDHNRGLLIGVALENLADNYLRADRKTSEYRNIIRA